METNIKNLRALRDSLPNGMKDPFGQESSKRVLLLRALRRNSLLEATEGELAAIEEWLEYARDTKQKRQERNQRIEKKIPL